MARQPDIQYINAYVSGTMAYQMDAAPVRKKKQVRLPKQRHVAKKIIAVDPVALCGIVVAACMLVMMLVGLVKLQDAKADTIAMKQYVSSLEEQNLQLKDTYSAGYDLAEIEKIALAMGMVPSSQVPQIFVEVSVPQQIVQPTAWESFCTFLTGLFA